MYVGKTNRMFILFFGLFLFSSCAFQSEVADMIVHNARIYTMDDEMKIMEAMAIRDGRIIELGPERQILNKYRAETMIDCRKQPVYPGFIDAHCHFLGYGQTLQEMNLVGTKSWNEILEIARKHAQIDTAGWLVGRGWDQNDWTAPDSSEVVPFPDCAQLDVMFPDRPVYLTRIDGHAVLVNSAVLQMAGLTPDTKVEGGIIEVRDGKCTGILIDNAILFADSIMPLRTRAEKTEGLLRAQRNCFKVGLTTVSDAGLLRPDILLIDSLQRIGELPMRVYAMLSDDPINFEWYGAHGPDTSSEWLTVRSFKFYADGALGSRGACLLSPYEDILKKFRRSEYGKLLSTPEVMRSKFQMLYDLGFQVNTHAIGDSANRVILGLYAEVLGGANDRRWRIEHAQVMDGRDMPMFREYSIIPSVQPTHATSDMPWAWERLGRNRIRKAYAYKELKDQLGMIALGTDFPVEGISPLATFYAAVFRQNSEGMPAEGFQIENALSREEALRGITIWAAMANMEDQYKGSLEVGKVADVVVLDRDLMECTGLEVLRAKVQYTIIGGEVVYPVR